MSKGTKKTLLLATNTSADSINAVKWSKVQIVIRSHQPTGEMRATITFFKKEGSRSEHDLAYVTDAVFDPNTMQWRRTFDGEPLYFIKVKALMGKKENFIASKHEKILPRETNYFIKQGKEVQFTFKTEGHTYQCYAIYRDVELCVYYAYTLINGKKEYLIIRIN